MNNGCGNSSFLNDVINVHEFKDIFLFLLIIFVLSRIFFYIEYSFVSNTVLHTNNLHFVTDMFRWDSGNYASIATNGYDTTFNSDGGGNFVWLPLWPLILKIFSLNGILPIPYVSFLINQLLVFISLIVFYLYLLRLSFDKKDIQFCLCLLIFSPVNIYFLSGLTEPLFLFLSLSAFYCLKQDKIWLSIIFAALMGITKIVGVTFILPLLYYAYRKNKIDTKILIKSLVILIPLICYMIYLQIHVGDFIAFIHGQKAPGFARPGFDFGGDYIIQLQSMYGRATVYDLTAFFVSLFITTIILWRTRFYEESLFNLAIIVPIFISGGLWNSFRMCFGVFIAYLAVIALSQRFPYAKYVIFAASSAMTIVCMIFWLSGSWVFA